MSDTEQSPAPIPEAPDNLTAPTEAQPSSASAESEQASSGAAPVEPPPASGTQEGVDATPSGDSSPPGASALVETPVQGAAVIAGEAIPSADAQPVVRVVDVANLQAQDESSAPGTEAPPLIEATEVVPNAQENPLDTIQRLRAKLSAYGEECLASVQAEVEYLLSLCGPGPG